MSCPCRMECTTGGASCACPCHARPRKANAVGPDPEREALLELEVAFRAWCQVPGGDNDLIEDGCEATSKLDAIRKGRKG